MAVKQRLDTPTNNFATWNPLFAVSSPLYEGNLYAYGTTSGARSAFSTFEIPTTGKWYIEILSKDNQYPQAGIGRKEATGSGSSTACYGYYDNDTSNSPYALYDGASGSAATTLKDGFNLTSNSITRIYIDADKNQMWMGKDTTWATGDNTLGSVPTFGSGGTYNGSTPLNFADGYYILVSNGNGTDKWFLNAGQDASFNGNKTPTKVYTDARGLGRFYYQPPEGALALCTANIGASVGYKSAPTSYVSDETNTKILTYNGNVEQVPYSPYATDGYSIHFDSNYASSQIRTSTNSDLEFAANDFTVEFWLYHMGGDSTETIVSYPQWEGGNIQNGTAWQIRLSSSNTLLTDFGSGSAWRYEGNHTDLTVKQYDWNHIVLQRDDADIKIYCNGKPSSSFWNIGSGTAITDSAEFNSDFLCIGGYSGGQNLGGYIADFRIVNGTAVYTPDSGSGYISAPSSKLPTLTAAIANTKFLLSTDSKKFEDLSGTGKTVTTNNTPSIEAWSPYSTDAIEFGTEYRTPETAHEIGSFSFDGNSQQLKFATSADFELTGNATVEMWVYLNSAVAGNTPLFGYGNDAGNNYFVLFINAGGSLQWYQHGSLSDTESTASIGIGQWHHIALVRDGNTLKVYNNGVERISSSYTASFPTGHELRIGSWYNTTNYGANGHLNGYIADYRVVNGTAVYTGAFTPPSGKLTATGGTYPSGTGNVNTSITSGHTKLLLQPYKSYDADNLLTSNFSYERDSSSTPKSLTYVGNAKVADFAPYKSGANGSFSFDGNSNITIDPNELLSLGQTPFTIEFWVYPKPNSSEAHIFGLTHTSASQPGIGIKINANNTLYWIDSGAANYTKTSASTVKDNQWNHVAYCRDSSNNMSIYINGVKDSTTWTESPASDYTSPAGASNYARIGSNVGNDNGSRLEGNISDFRIVKGTGVYSGTSFTPPYDSLTTTGGSYASSTNISNPTSASETVLLLQPGALASNDPAKKPFEHFKVVKWAGTGASNDSDNKTFSSDSSTWTNTNHEIDLDFTPDYVWAKARNSAQHWNIIDSVRGDNKVLISSTSGSEYDVNTSQGGGLYSIANKGFTLDSGTGAGNNYHSNLNDSSYNSVAFCFKAGGKTPSKTYYVKVVADGGNKYRFIDDVTNTNHPTLNLQEGGTYTFDVSDSTMSSHPFVLGTSSGTDGSYTTGVTYQLDGVSKTYSQYTSGFSSATVRKLIITVASSAPTLYYNCSVHPGMGGQINTTTTHGQTEFGGSIIPIVSANKEAGFSIAKWVGNNTNNASISHGLTKTPDIVVFKNTSDTTNWGVKLNPSTISAVSNEQQYLYFNLTNSFGTNTGEETQLTSSIIKFVGTNLNFSNGSGDNMIAYCWHSVPGFSSFGSYEGNAAGPNGPFIYTGFKPAWLMIKNVDSTGPSWDIYDNAREPFNDGSFANLSANSSGTESSRAIDFLSNGFKIRETNSWNINSSETFIFVCFAEAPVNFSNAR